MSDIPHAPGHWSAEIVNPQGGRSWVSAPSRRWLAERVAAQLGVAVPPLHAEPRSVNTSEEDRLRVIAYEREVGAVEVAAALSVSRAAAHGRLLRACRRGLIVRVVRGRYRASA